MIGLTYLQPTCKWAIRLGDWLVGPIDLTGQTRNDYSTYQCTDDYLQEGLVCLHHERDVTHLHGEGELVYNPFTSRIVSSPTDQYPNRVLIGSWDFPLGMVDGQFSSLNMIPTPSVTAKNTLSIRTSADSVEQYEVEFNKATNKIIRILHTEWTFVRQSDASHLYYKKVDSYYSVSLGFYTEDTWNSPQDIKAFLGAWAYSSEHAYQGKLQILTTYANVSLRPVLTDLDFAMGPADIWVKVELLERALDLGDDYVHPDEVHFGILAMEASERLNATSVNLIAFLRDLRNPLDMIPKLKNLRSLKNLGSLKDAASDFLAVKYGALPTVSDLQNLLSIFRRVKPSLDRNGFRTCYAGRTFVTNSGGSLTTTVVQRLKLGVAKEDNGFEALAEGLENIGALPTFKNLWDLVPYSFVLDWFVDVGNLLERVDTHLRLLRLNIRYATMSRKVTTELVVSNDRVPFTYGTIRRVQYHRGVTGHAPVPPLSLQSSSNAQSHWLEASALIIQRKH